MSAIQWLELLILAIHAYGIFLAVTSVFVTRTSQGAVAWAISLVTFPYVAVPAYLIFGRNRFDGYAEALRKVCIFTPEELKNLRERLSPLFKSLPESAAAAERVFEKLSIMEFSVGNSADLLIDGERTFEAIFAEIERAESYILAEFYILRDDDLGRRFSAALRAKAAQGVRVYLLYDGIGSYFLPGSYLQTLENSGACTASFYSARGRRNRFQINFRNHRKIVVVDGKTAFVGGHNVGDEYLGKNPAFGRWRDTHVRIEGPAVLGIQFAFLSDWIWSRGESIPLSWEPRKSAADDMAVLPLATGPVERREGCVLMFLQLIGMARKRLWIASPYFVPDEAVTAALELAAARGVDVRILIPSKADQMLVWLASFSYIDQCSAAGIRMFRFQPGFLHEKAMLVDDEWACISTANLDNRSLRLNFEISMIAYDRGFASRVEQMFLADFEASREVAKGDYQERAFLFRACAQGARLFAPIL